MSLPINPLAKSATSAIQSIATGAVDSVIAVKSSAQAALDAKVNTLSGAVGTNLNGFASGVSSIGNAASGAAGDFANVIGGAAGGIGGALSGIGSTIQSSVSGAIGSAADAIGAFSLPGAAGGLIDAIGGGIANKFNSAAGQIDDILSNFRGKNVPGGAELFPPAGGAGIELVADLGNDWRVRIDADWTIFNDPLMQRLSDTGGVVWPYTPAVTISTKANYTQIEPVHNNYPFQSYKNSQVEDITISGEFSCETAADAEYWIAATTFFKAATKMFFGQGQYAGNPPIICRLTGYGGSIFNNVPIVIKNFTVELRDDVDYINCNNGSVTSNTWVPILSTISVTVSPIYNRERLRTFNLQNYVTGKPNRSEIGFM